VRDVANNPEWRWHNDNKCGVLRTEDYTYTVWQWPHTEPPMWGCSVNLLGERSIMACAAVAHDATWQAALEAARDAMRARLAMLADEV
jgi:hypothetical protein